MAVKTMDFRVESRGEGQTHDITARVADAVTRSGLAAGAALVFAPGSTMGITSIEYEPGAVADLAEAFERLAPRDKYYKHEEAWRDGNGFSHVRAALLGQSFSAPFADGELILGTWQQIALIDFDNKPRTRRVVVQLIGE